MIPNSTVTDEMLLGINDANRMPNQSIIWNKNTKIGKNDSILTGNVVI